MFETGSGIAICAGISLRKSTYLRVRARQIPTFCMCREISFWSEKMTYKDYPSLAAFHVPTLDEIADQRKQRWKQCVELARASKWQTSKELWSERPEHNVIVHFHIPKSRHYQTEGVCFLEDAETAAKFYDECVNLGLVPMMYTYVPSAPNKQQHISNSTFHK